jgi:hypothetical protein
MNSRDETMAKTLMAGSAVYLLKIYAQGTGTSHAKQLSKRKVTVVLPPERIVK